MSIQDEDELASPEDSDKIYPILLTFLNFQVEWRKIYEFY